MRVILHPPHSSLSHATPSLFFPPLRFRKVKVALLFAPFPRLNSSNIKRKIVCKCRLWFRLMYPGYEVPLNERASSSPPVKAWQSTFAGQWTPRREDNRKKLFFAVRWSDKRKSRIFFFKDFAAPPQHAPFWSAWEGNCRALIEWWLIVEVFHLWCFSFVFFYVSPFSPPSRMRRQESCQCF